MFLVGRAVSIHIHFTPFPFVCFWYSCPPKPARLPYCYKCNVMGLICGWETNDFIAMPGIISSKFPFISAQFGPFDFPPSTLVSSLPFSASTPHLCFHPKRGLLWAFLPSRDLSCLASVRCCTQRLDLSKSVLKTTPPARLTPP